MTRPSNKLQQARVGDIVEITVRGRVTKMLPREPGQTNSISLEPEYNPAPWSGLTLNGYQSELITDVVIAPRAAKVGDVLTTQEQLQALPPRAITLRTTYPSAVCMQKSSKGMWYGAYPDSCGTAEPPLPTTLVYLPESE